MKLWKKILIVVGIILLMLFLFILPMMFTMMSFAPAKTGEITKELYTIKDGFINIFVLKTGDELICFDAGNTPKGVEAGFKELGLDILKVKAVFLTHSDGDHVNGLPAFKNAVVYLPEKEEPLVTGAVKRKFMFLGKKNPLPVSVYKLIKDGEEVKFGKYLIKAVLTPGHTIGSTSYIADGKYLMVGDLAITKDGKLTGMPKPPSEDPETIKVSLKAIESIKGVKYIATAHGGVIKQ